MPGINLYLFLYQLIEASLPPVPALVLSDAPLLARRWPVYRLRLSSPQPRAVSLRCEPGGDGRSLEMRTALGGLEVRTDAAEPSQARTTFAAPT